MKKQLFINLFCPCLLIFGLMAVVLFTGCRKEAPVGPESTPPDITDNTGNNRGAVKGLYVLCEGNMGSSSSSLNFYDFEKDTLYRNVFYKANRTL